MEEIAVKSETVVDAETDFHEVEPDNALDAMLDEMVWGATLLTNEEKVERQKLVELAYNLAIADVLLILKEEKTVDNLVIAEIEDLVVDV